MKRIGIWGKITPKHKSGPKRPNGTKKPGPAKQKQGWGKISVKH